MKISKSLSLAFVFMLWVTNAQAILFNPPSSYLITANLELYDTGGNLVVSATEDGWSLFTAGTVTFTHSSLVSDFVVHDFTLIADLAGAATVGMQLDWGLSSNIYNEAVWHLIIGDDFVNGIAYYDYYSEDTDHDGVPGAKLNGDDFGVPYDAFTDTRLLETGMTANFSISMASGAAPVPVPSSIWLLFSGVMGFSRFISMPNKSLQDDAKKPRG